MYIGIDIGGTNTKIGIVSFLGRIVNSSIFKTMAPRPINSLFEDIVNQIDVLLKKENLTRNDIEGIGCGIPGIIDSKNGIIVVSANLQYKKVNLREMFEKEFSVPCVICNDANCAAFGEQRFGSAKEYKNVVFLTIGTGIGSGIIIDNQLFEGVGCAGAEAGHMTIVYNGEKCTCGGCGCWERYASVGALIRQTTKALELHPDSYMEVVKEKYGKISGRTAFEAAKKGDKTARDVVNQYLDYLLCGIVNLSYLFHPNIFIIGGGVSNEGAALIEPLKNKLNDVIVRSNFYPKIEVKKAALGNNAGLLGAAALGMVRNGR